MRILVTGAGGFVGAAVVDAALTAGHEAIAAIRPGGNRQRLAGRTAKVVELDLGNRAQLDEVMGSSQPDVVVHAAWSGVSNAARNNRSQIFDNVVVTAAVADAATANGIRKFIGIGSQGEYGQMSGRIAETAVPAPNSLYGAAKLAAQVLSSQLCVDAGTQFAWLRLFSTYGPGDNGHWLIPSLIGQMLEGQRPRMTEGRQLWDYLFIDDVAAAILAVAERSDASGVFNLGSGQPLAVSQIAQMIRDLAAPNLELLFGEIPYRPDQIWHMEADIDRLTRLTGFVPQVSLAAGLSRTVAWHRSVRTRHRP